ncbi:HNH endonuclease [Sphingomonas endolithica]|uniref:HNH endonuclease n=1 Tax=Sphingomonas endolithica TaxID=2972485 RepID=UPI0021AE644E|nr:HNH endonuclease [Sphingomonas sp. ZFBP2030]
MTPFLAVQPTSHNQFRALMLFGRNVASYKFALAKALLEVARGGPDLIKLEELAGPYTRHLRTHLAQAAKQATSQSSRFLEACRGANAGNVSDDELQSITVSLGFNNVIDAFHRLGSQEVEQRFFLDERSTTAGIRITNALQALAHDPAAADLGSETEARWCLVETAWKLGVTSSLIAYDNESQAFTAADGSRRVAVTSARAALNGYQKGRCFYCFTPVTIEPGRLAADIDHVFPWALRLLLSGNPNGVWNLVLACRHCNRGSAGKFDCVPALELVSRLHRRNEFLITSHHPLGETLMAQTGSTSALRVTFLQRNYDAAKLARIIEWNAAIQHDAAF